MSALTSLRKPVFSYRTPFDKACLMQDRISIIECSDQAGCHPGTTRNYLRRGVIEGLKDPWGKWWLHPDTPRKIREHMRENGGPGGMPLIAPS